MSEKDNSVQPVAWLLTGGRLFSDRVVMGKGEADKAISMRNDGSVLVPLVRADQSLPAPTESRHA